MGAISLHKWIDDVQSNKLKISDNAKKCVMRHISDLERTDDLFYYNHDIAMKYINFIEKMKFTEGSVAGQFFKLNPDQQFIVAMIFGWREKDTDKRRFTDAYLQMAKKSAKTTLGCAIALAMFYLDPEMRAQYYFAATSRDQANIAFNTSISLAQQFAIEYEDVDDCTAFRANSLQRTDTGSFMRSISKAAGNVEGRGAYFCFGDEYHLHISDEVINNVSSGSALAYKDNSLLIRATTAGNSIMGACHVFLLNVALKVIDGIIDHDRLFVYIADFEEKDWEDLKKLYHKGWPSTPDGTPKDLAIWKKANPNCPVCPELKFLREKFHEAMIQGGKKEIDVKTKHGNMWCSTAVTWISDDIYMRGSMPTFKEEDTYGMTANVGIDLARTTDIASVVVDVIQPMPGEKDIHYLIPFFFIPEAKLNDVNDRVDYAKWAMEGHVIVAGTTDIDDEIIEEKIMWILKKWNINAIVYDPALVNRLINSIKTKTSVKVRPISQGYTALTPPTKELRRLILSNRIRHNGHPVMRWMMSNVYVQEKGDYIKITKEKCINKVDGPVSWVFALGGYIFEKEEKKNAPVAMVV